MEKLYNRQLISYLSSYLPEQVGLELVHLNVNYPVIDEQDYKEMIGSSLITVYPFRDSPMPRSRTESMFSGACVLSSRYHNADEFIEHGVNGFIMPDNPMSYVETINQLVNHNYRETVKIGQRGKEMAVNTFKLDRYLAQWNELLHEVVAGNRPEWTGGKIW